MRTKITALAFSAGLVVGTFSAAEAGFISAAPVAAHLAGAGATHSKAQNAKTAQPGEASADSQDESGSTEQADSKTGSGKSTKAPGQHPCNKGFYISQAAHNHSAKGGKHHNHGGYVSSVAQNSSLGTWVSGGCTTKLPTP